ncbi:MAG TPA: tRNA 2-methylthio-N6-isopentenyl adenosine(37) hydroxylase MiaE, partial [Bacteroidetes bacterium]|nr:tRNA 2-methylthio-N6-isopentenyl adenosine(37) hydroxylase MiaE [Bacteroidota bacterium]
MLGLKLKTDPRWVKNAVEQNVAEILTDHAYCEQKAASHAISLIVIFPEHTELVDEMTDLALEEMEHFKMV